MLILVHVVDQNKERSQQQRRRRIRRTNYDGSRKLLSYEVHVHINKMSVLQEGENLLATVRSCALRGDVPSRVAGQRNVETVSLNPHLVALSRERHTASEKLNEKDF